MGTVVVVLAITVITSGKEEEEDVYNQEASVHDLKSRHGQKVEYNSSENN